MGKFKKLRLGVNMGRISVKNLMAMGKQGHDYCKKSHGYWQAGTGFL